LRKGKKELEKRRIMYPAQAVDQGVDSTAGPFLAGKSTKE
jgi:hypothetical protein